MKQALKPPPTLASIRVLEYAILDDSVIYSGHSNLFVGDEELGPVPRLAICHAVRESRFLLFHCNQDWNILGSEAHESLAKAKASAEESYPGVSGLWVDAGSTAQDAAEHLDKIWGDQRCNFCGRIPPDFENPRFIQKNNAWVCDVCVMTLYEILQRDSKST